MLTGRVAIACTGRSVAFESPLERDFYMLLDFDRRVSRVEGQPMRIEYLRPDGAHCVYTPDVLVHYAPEWGIPPALFEVKPEAELREHWNQFRPRFKAALKCCRRRGWTFRIRSERHIRTPYLGNARHLREHRFTPADELMKRRISGVVMSSAGDLTIRQLLASLDTQSVEHKGMLLSMLWHMLANGELVADLNITLGYETVVSLPCPRNV